MGLARTAPESLLGGGATVSKRATIVLIRSTGGSSIENEIGNASCRLPRDVSLTWLSYSVGTLLAKRAAVPGPREDIRP